MNSFLFIFVLYTLRCISAFELPGSRDFKASGGSHRVSWIRNSSRIDFTLEFQTHGYIGFGVSPNGGMTNGDMLMGGVSADGSIYLKSYYGVGNTMPVEKEIGYANWHLTSAKQNATHTILQVWRYVQACGGKDLAINEGTSRLIWAIGETDEIHYHGSNRGSFSANLLDPPTNQPISQFKVWNATQENMMPPIETMYYCTMHKGPPKITHKPLHITGFSAILPDELATAHTHHFVLYKCRSPPEGTGVFEEAMKTKGAPCYPKEGEPSLLGKEFCTLAIFLWGLGGERFLFPDNIGYPINEKKDADYFVLELHYNNPQKLKNVHFKTGMEFYYTEERREFDAEILTTGKVVSKSMVIPPNVKNFVVAGHCAPACTQALFPPKGIKIFNVLLHAHISGRRIVLRHFRGQRELPWILLDENYDSEYQQNRQLAKEVEVLPGDHLMLECTYDTTWRETDTVIQGGEGTGTEMCQTFTWYYPRAEMEFCTSDYPNSDMMKDFKIKNGTYSEEGEMIVTDPKEWEGLTFTEVMNSKTNWTGEFKEKIQEKQRYADQLYYCSSFKRGIIDEGHKVKYPKVKEEYVPPKPDKCPQNI